MARSPFLIFVLLIVVQGKVKVYSGQGSGCSTLLYVETFSLTIAGNTPIDLTQLQELSTTCSVIKDGDGRAMSISYGEGGEMPTDVKGLKIEFTFSKTTTGYWNSNDMTVSYTNANGTNNVSMSGKFTPVSLISTSFSFACSLPSNTAVISANNTDAENKESATLTLDKYQLEVYEVEHNQFSAAVQCVNWISKGAWMGILAGILTITVLVMSVMMLLNTTTPDKFETSKSKCLIIPHEH